MCHERDNLCVYGADVVTRCRCLDGLQGMCVRVFVCVHMCVITGAGIESCNQCADGYLMEEWRCVSSCSVGFYATESSPQKTSDGPRICRR